MLLASQQDDSVRVDGLVIKIAIEMDMVTLLELAGVHHTLAIRSFHAEPLHGDELVRLAVEAKNDVVAIHSEFLNLAFEGDRIQARRPFFETVFTLCGHSHERYNGGE